MKKIKILVAAIAMFVCAGFVFAQENIIAHGDMEGASLGEWIAEGSTLSLPAGKGVSGSTALYVRGKFNWSGVGKDLTKMNITDGSDYYVEVWFKADNGDKGKRHSDVALAIQPDDCTEEDYDNFIYMGLDPVDGKYTGSSIELSNKEYVKVCGVISGEEIKNQLNGRKAVNVTIYFKIDAPTRPFYVDNVVIKKNN